MYKYILLAALIGCGNSNPNEYREAQEKAELKKESVKLVTVSWEWDGCKENEGMFSIHNYANFTIKNTYFIIHTYTEDNVDVPLVKQSTDVIVQWSSSSVCIAVPVNTRYVRVELIDADFESM